MTEKDLTIGRYVKQILLFESKIKSRDIRTIARDRFEKALFILPAEVLDLFLSGARSLNVVVARDPGFPLGMKTAGLGAAGSRRYTITIYEEHGQWSEDVFIGALLRGLAHVVAQLPPESEWPASRGDRARFKERLECRADAIVWKWGLRHYDMTYLGATYPEHWVEKIVEDIGNMMMEDAPPQ